MPCDIFFVFLFRFLFSSSGQTVALAQLPGAAYRPIPDVSFDVVPSQAVAGWRKTSERPKRKIAGINRASEPGKKETNRPRTMRASIPRTPSPENYAMMKESLVCEASRLGLRGGLVSIGLGLLLSRRLSVGLGRLGGSLGVTAVRRGPQGKVVPEQLHDESAVAVRLLRERVKLGNGIVERLLGEVASTVGRVENLVVEDREVKGKTEADWVSWGQLGLGDIGSALRGSHGGLVLPDLYATGTRERKEEREGIFRDSPCRPRGQQWPQPCASRPRRTRPGIGGSHPSYIVLPR